MPETNRSKWAATAAILLMAVVAIGAAIAISNKPTTVHLRAENPYPGMNVPIELPFNYWIKGISAADGVYVDYPPGNIQASTQTPIIITAVPEGLPYAELKIEVVK